MERVARITGVVGTLTWAGYNPAASINNYVVTRHQHQWALSATVVQVNKYNITQRPLVFTAPHQKGRWRWPVRRVRFPVGDYPPDVVPFVLTAELDPPDFHPEGPIYVVPVRTTRSRQTVVING